MRCIETTVCQGYGRHFRFFLSICEVDYLSTWEANDVFSDVLGEAAGSCGIFTFSVVSADLRSPRPAPVSSGAYVTRETVRLKKMNLSSVAPTLDMTCSLMAAALCGGRCSSSISLKRRGPLQFCGIVEHGNMNACTPDNRRSLRSYLFDVVSLQFLFLARSWV